MIRPNRYGTVALDDDPGFIWREYSMTYALAVGQAADEIWAGLVNDRPARMRCKERGCGHEYQLQPVIGADGSRYFGSAYDFCEKCDGVVEELCA